MWHPGPQDQFRWWQRGVIYQVYPRSLSDSNGDGIGDLPGIVSRLDYLSWLGVDAIWVSPFYPSPMVDFGYDVVDYTGVDPIFGTLADFDRLVAEAHRRDLRIIIDFVPNHTSVWHPWFVESRASRVNPKRDWYLWQDPAPGGGPPNNWLAVFGGPAWEWDEHTGQYYLHSFLVEQPDLNWRNPEVVDAMHGVMRFWLDRGADGFRADAVHYMIKDALWRDNPPAARQETGMKPLGPFDQFEHLYDLDQPEVHQVVRGMRRVVDEYPDRLLLGETYLGDVDSVVRYYGENLDGLHLPANLRMMHLPWQASVFRAVVDEYEAALPPGAWPNYVLGSHDESRLGTRFGVQQARAAAMLLLTLRGTPTIYYGEEIGMLDVDVPPESVHDPLTWNVPGLGLGRDPQRTPMQWDASANAGFTQGTPWLPLAADHAERNVAVQQSDPTSMLSLYRQLLTARRQSPALHAGSYTPVDTDCEAAFAYLREAQGQRMLVVLNFSGDHLTLALGDLIQEAALHVSTYLDGPPITPGALKVRPHEGLLLILSH